MKILCLFGLLAALLMVNLRAWAEMPPITGKPVIDAPLLLDWPTDRGLLVPNLNDPTANTLNDFHAQISSCDLVFSTEGNYHPALKDIWPVFLAKFKDQPLLNWFYTTSPPVSVAQIEKQMLQVGNLYATCRPAVVVATPKVISRLEQAGHTEGPAHPLLRDRGQVLLVKKNNPKKIRSVWDLGGKRVRLVTPNPELEPGAFENYAGTIFNIAALDPHPRPGLSAAKLFDLLFNGGSGDPEKWLAGPRIHHRDLPWSVAYGRADAAVIFYHLGLYIQQTFPDKFALVPLGGTVDHPQPLAGTVSVTRYLVRIKGNWTPRQLEAREKLVETLLSDEFTQVLEKRGLMRPPAENQAR
ncbi:MAG: substrate-binding domain-containing protein [Desulfobaccales bacterium]